MAMLTADFAVDAAGHALRELVSLVGWSDIKHAVDKVQAAVKRRRFVSDALLQRYAVPLGLSRAFAYEKSTGRTLSPLASTDAYAASSFAIMAAEISRALSPRARQRLSGIIRHNLSLYGDARTLQHEFRVAAHFTQRGWDIEFCDLERNGGFDYIVRKAGVEVEVECKTISGDVGNAIHRLDAANLMESVHECLLECAKEGWWTIDVTFPTGLPKERPRQLALAREIVACMREMRPGAFEGATIEAVHRTMPAISATQDLHAFADQVKRSMRDRRNGHAAVVYGRNPDHLLGFCVSTPLDTDPTEQESAARVGTEL